MEKVKFRMLIHPGWFSSWLLCGSGFAFGVEMKTRILQSFLPQLHRRKDFHGMVQKEN